MEKVRKGARKYEKVWKSMEVVTRVQNFQESWGKIMKIEKSSTSTSTGGQWAVAPVELGDYGDPSGGRARPSVDCSPWVVWGTPES